eukprot:Hpha_TRINITY_DN16120_c0_g5::TRINITY_DN16120_c0_g5_i1::g.4868::m.4868
MGYEVTEEVGRVARVGDQVRPVTDDVLRLADAEKNPEEFVLEPGDHAEVIEVDDVGDFRLRNAQGVESGWTYAKHFFFVGSGRRCGSHEVEEVENGGHEVPDLDSEEAPKRRQSSVSSAPPSPDRPLPASPAKSPSGFGSPERGGDNEVIDVTIDDTAFWGLGGKEDRPLDGAAAGELAAIAASEATERAKAAIERARQAQLACSSNSKSGKPPAPPKPREPPPEDPTPVPTVLLLRIERHAQNQDTEEGEGE